MDVCCPRRDGRQVLRRRVAVGAVMGLVLMVRLAPAAAGLVSASTAPSSGATASTTSSTSTGSSASTVSTSSATSTVDTLPSVYNRVVGANALQQQGYTGKGVTVALIDTGVAALRDLSGRIVPVT